MSLLYLAHNPAFMGNSVRFSRIVDYETTLQCLEDDIAVKIENRLSKGRNNSKPPNMEIISFKGIHVYNIIYTTYRIH